MIVSSVICVSTALVSTLAQMHADEGALLTEYRQRVQAMAELGGHILSKPDVYELWRQSSPKLLLNKVPEIEQSQAYQRVWGQLHSIQQVDHDLIRYVYLLRSFDRDAPRFLADADVLRPNPPNILSHFNDTYPVDAVPHLRDSLQKCELQVEPDFVRDEEYGVRSLSAYAPISIDDLPSGACIVLGIDMVDDDARHMPTSARVRAWRDAMGRTVLLLVLVNISILLLTRPWRSWVRILRRVRSMALTYCRLNEMAAQTSVQQLNMDLDAIELFCSNRGDDMARQYVASIFASPSTAERVRNDVVPDLILQTPPATPADAVMLHDQAIVLVAMLAGFRTLSAGQTEQGLTSWHEVFEEYGQLAHRYNVMHARTTGSCFLAVVTSAREPGAAASIVGLAREMIEVARRHGERARVPLCAAIGVDLGRIALCVDNESKRVVDLWGDVALGARLLQQRAPVHGIQISARVAALLDDLEVRHKVPQANGEITFVIFGNSKISEGSGQ